MGFQPAISEDDKLGGAANEDRKPRDRHTPTVGYSVSCRVKRPPEESAAHNGEEYSGYEAYPEEHGCGVIGLRGVTDPALQAIVWLPPEPLNSTSHPNLMRAVQECPESGQYTQQHRHKHSYKHASTTGSCSVR